ncbi:hypothetical protein GWK47_025589 [Chionoecetes opilio]|uniref:Uncharacterized protein n=1 Tax=Chionoecetes opilio TaxID=41210 RepID=A0A8J8WB04_CHIOP|nr:hypothetical protein GWK47_025589 [Chionoecetes opilio]
MMQKFASPACPQLSASSCWLSMPKEICPSLSGLQVCQSLLPDSLRLLCPPVGLWHLRDMFPDGDVDIKHVQRASISTRYRGAATTLNLSRCRLASVSGLYLRAGPQLRASHPHPNHTGTNATVPTQSPPL